MKFRRKAVVIDAVEYTGTNVSAIVEEIGLTGFSEENGLVIYTLEGKMKASVGDWIIKGVRGEFYPCKPDIFNQIYEAAC